MKGYIYAWKRYADFKGRSTREELFGFIWMNFAILTLLTLIDTQLGLVMYKSIGITRNLYALAVLIPTLAIGVRRLHDTNRSGGYILINLIPIVGGILYLIWILQPSHERGYHPNSKILPEAQEENRTEKIIIFSVLYHSIYAVLNQTMNLIFGFHFMSNNGQMLFYHTTIMTLLSSFAIAFALKNKTYRVIAIVIACLYPLQIFLQYIAAELGWYSF